MSREGPTGDTARFAREWNFALLLVLAIAGLLLAASRPVAGAIAIGLCAAAFAARWSAMRKQGRSFYGQDQHPARRESVRGGGKHG